MSPYRVVTIVRSPKTLDLTALSRMYRSLRVCARMRREHEVGKPHDVGIREAGVRASSIENAVWGVRGRQSRASQSDTEVRDVRMQVRW